MTRQTRADILEAAGTALLIPGAWTQKVIARNASGHRRCSEDKDATCFCVLGAISAAAIDDKSWSTIRVLNNKLGGDVIAWNDKKGQTAENVAHTLFELAQELRKQ